MDEVRTSGAVFYQLNDRSLFLPQNRPVGELTC
jgi:hypothetical protein